MDNPDEIINDKSNILKVAKNLICFIKKSFCILTIKENNICVLPYKNIKNKTIINVITKIIAKNAQSVVLSNNLNKIECLKDRLIDRKVHIYNGKMLSNYLDYNFVEYISKFKNEEAYVQEVSILVSSCNSINAESIIYLAKKIKRINIVTTKISDFGKIATCLENEMGIGITVTNNKRKSLAKSKIIINIDFNEEMINQFNINRDAIIININNKAQVKSKLFNGINVYDYGIEYKKNLDDELYKNFDEKLVYESKISGKSYNEIIEQISNDNVKIVNLIGKNGPIDIMEYKRN